MSLILPLIILFEGISPLCIKYAIGKLKKLCGFKVLLMFQNNPGIPFLDTKVYKNSIEICETFTDKKSYFH